MGGATAGLRIEIGHPADRDQAAEQIEAVRDSAVSGLADIRLCREFSPLAWYSEAAQAADERSRSADG